MISRTHSETGREDPGAAASANRAPRHERLRPATNPRPKRTMHTQLSGRKRTAPYPVQAGTVGDDRSSGEPLRHVQHSRYREFRPKAVLGWRPDSVPRSPRRFEDAELAGCCRRQMPQRWRWR